MVERDPRHQYSEGADFYDDFPLYAARPDVAFYVDEAKKHGEPVLEIGCGTGRVLIPTIRAEVEVTGLDLSTEMLAVCESRLAQEPDDVRQRATLVQGDMRSFDLQRTFNVVTIPFRPIQHLIEIEDQLACLRCVHRHLEPSGALIFDAFFPSYHYLVDDERMAPHQVGEPYTLADGRVVRRFDHIVSRDLHRQVQQVRLVYDIQHPDGRTERLHDDFPMRYFFRWELEHLLARAGFEIENVYCDFDRTPFGEAYPGEMVVIAQRKS